MSHGGVRFNKGTEHTVQGCSLGSGRCQIMKNYFLGLSRLEEDSAAESLVFQNYDKNRQKKQAWQKLSLHTTDHINDLGPPVQLGIMGPGYSIIFQSQITVLNHSIEGVFIEKFFCGGLIRVFCSQRSFIWHTVYCPALNLQIDIFLLFFCVSNSVLCAVS